MFPSFLNAFFSSETFLTTVSAETDTVKILRTSVNDRNKVVSLLRNLLLFFIFIPPYILNMIKVITSVL